MEFSGGFHTLDQEDQLRPFGRGTFFLAALYKGAAVLVYDWNTSTWHDDDLTDNKGTWSGSQGEQDYDAPSGDDTQPYAVTPIPYIDDSGGTKYLKFMFGYNHHDGDTYQALMEGERVDFGGGAVGNNVFKSATGISFADNHPTVGTHTIRFETRHDAPKASSDKYWTYTVVMDCTDRDPYWDIHWYVARKANSHPGPAPTTISAADCIAGSGGSGVVYWDSFGWTWLKTSSEWYVIADETYWKGSSSGTTNVSATANRLGMQKLQTAYYVDDDTDDHTMWEVTVVGT